MSEDHDEITLSIALLGGIIVILWNIIDYSNSQSLEFFSNLKPAFYLSIAFLFTELLIIFLFFIFKGISLKTKNSEQDIFEPIAQKLFKLSFVIAVGWFIASILTVIFKTIYTLSGWWIFIVYSVIFILSSGAVISTTKFIDIEKICNKLKNFPTSPNKDNTIILFIFIVILIILLFDIILVPIISSSITYLLTGSYSIEEVSPSIDNPDMLTFSMKEKGISYNSTEVRLYKLDTSDPEILIRKDNITTYKREARLSSYLWVININYIWYLNIINTSYLPSGTYQLEARVKNNDDPVIIGGSKRIAEKLFYIPPKRTNYSCNGTQI